MRVDQAPRHLIEACCLCASLLAACLPLRLMAGDAADAGETIYRRLCASCHGISGEGVEGKHSRPLAGEKSVERLARFIERWMPEDDPAACTGAEAELVARYVHEAFYSPLAQARRQAPRKELSRLTVRQYRNAAADLAGSFRPQPPAAAGERGLRGEYFNSRQPGRNGVLERIDPEVEFDFGRSNPDPEKLGVEGFAARWRGSLSAAETGMHEIIVRTDHAARLWLNDGRQPLIDAWVKSGSETEYRASRFLLGGRAYPLRLEFTSRRQGVEDQKKEGEVKPVEAFIELCWKAPGGVVEVIPSRHLSAESGPEVFVLQAPFPPDDRSIGYERGTSVSRAWSEAATAAALETASYVVERLDELAGVKREDAESEPTLREFCRKLVERAFRRPLGAEERELYIDRQFSTAPEPKTAVKRVVLLALKSPRFLYLHAGGDAPSSHEVAQRLSFALWDSLPDGELLDAASRCELASRQQVVRHAARMLQDSRARSKVRHFFHHWLDIDPLPDLAKGSEHFPEFGAELASDLRTSLDLFLDEVVWNQDGDFRRLLLANELFVNGRLARYYGFELPAGAPFRKVPALEMDRAGVLAHPYLMARFAYTDVSSPIHRGVFVTRSLLGRPLRPPPEAFSPLSPALHPDLTTRERVALQTEPRACQGCHETINALGFAFEHFDADGRFRRSEKGKPIDASGAYAPYSGAEQAFAGARALAELLASSEETHQAFVLQLFHYLVKQPLAAYGPEAAATLRRVFAAADFDVRKLIVEIAAIAALGPRPQAEEDPPADPPSPGRRAARRLVRL